MEQNGKSSGNKRSGREGKKLCQITKYFNSPLYTQPLARKDVDISCITLFWATQGRGAGGCIASPMPLIFGHLYTLPAYIPVGTRIRSAMVQSIDGLDKLN